MASIELLQPKRHDRAAFHCGEPSLDDYIRHRASQHQRDGIATTHVLVHENSASQILGYYTLAAAQLLLVELQDVDRSRLPRYPVPAVRMARLAVALSMHGNGHGEELLAHAVSRCLDLRSQLGVRVILVDALNERAERFYRHYGFMDTVGTAGTLYLPLGKPSQ